MDSGSDFHEKIEIFVCCRDTKSHTKQNDIQIKCHLEESGDWRFIGETEVIPDNPQPNFATSFVLDFYFEVKQPIRLEIYNTHKKGSPELLGTVDTTVGSIMGARMQTSTFDLKIQDKKVPGQMITQAEKVGYGVDAIHWQWKGAKLLNTDRFSKSDPFLRFYKIRPDGQALKVYETETVKDNLNPVWKPFEIPAGKLCYDNSQLFRVECLDWEKAGKYQLIGSCEVSLDMIQGGYANLDLMNPKKKQKTGTLTISDFSLKSTVSFVDFIRSGTQLNAVVAIDFTASNGEPEKEGSLHASLPEGELNEYQKAIKAVCEIILSYDFDQLVPVYGFGGRPHYPTLETKGTSHCFPCTGNEQHHVLGLEGIMGVYSHALQNVELTGPTLFNPLITETMNACKVHQKDQADIYTILLILTDGEIHDIDKTIETVIDASHLPLSIIIIGVGEADFSRMVILDGDKGLVGLRSRRPARDIVQFVPFRDFKGDMVQLAQHVLAEVPDQLVNYMRMIGKKPLPPKPV